MEFEIMTNGMSLDSISKIIQILLKNRILIAKILENIPHTPFLPIKILIICVLIKHGVLCEYQTLLISFHHV